MAICITAGIHFLRNNLYLPDLSLHQNTEHDPTERLSEFRMRYQRFKQKIINQIQVFKLASCHSASFFVVSCRNRSGYVHEA